MVGFVRILNKLKRIVATHGVKNMGVAFSKFELNFWQKGT